MKTAFFKKTFVIIIVFLMLFLTLNNVYSFSFNNIFKTKIFNTTKNEPNNTDSNIRQKFDFNQKTNIKKEENIKSIQKFLFTISKEKHDLNDINLSLSEETLLIKNNQYAGLIQLIPTNYTYKHKRDKNVITPDFKKFGNKYVVSFYPFYEKTGSIASNVWKGSLNFGNYKEEDFKSIFKLNLVFNNYEEAYNFYNSYLSNMDVYTSLSVIFFSTDNCRIVGKEYYPYLREREYEYFYECTINMNSNKDVFEIRPVFHFI